MKKRQIIQNHRIMAKRLRALASAALSKDNDDAYKQFTEQAEQHERASNIFRHKTYIFER